MLSSKPFSPVLFWVFRTLGSIFSNASHELELFSLNVEWFSKFSLGLFLKEDSIGYFEVFIGKYVKESYWIFITTVKQIIKELPDILLFIILVKRERVFIMQILHMRSYFEEHFINKCFRRLSVVFSYTYSFFFLFLRLFKVL